MLYVPGVDTNYERRLDKVLSRSSVESTTDGFTYYVSDISEPLGMSFGSVFRTPEQSALTLVINGNISPENRKKIATTAVEAEAHLDDERYWLAQALHEIIAWNDDKEFAENITAINIMFEAIRTQNASIQRDPNIDSLTKARLRLEALSAMGMLATYRGVTTLGVEAYDEFRKQGLWIPNVSAEEVELSGTLHRKNGPVVANFKAMEEKSERHNCACCGAQLIKGMTRVTLGLEVTDGYSDHHHYHQPCFIDSVIPRFNLATIVERPLRLH